jgi:EAL domain-containing protein (putative c-di-GMP-specific phosphodiesterase class I)
MYVSRDIFVDRKEFMKKSWYYIILFCIAAFVISLTPEKLQLEGNYLYAYGLGVYVTYVFALVFIIAILIRVNVNSRKMNVDRRVAVNFWMGIWVMAALVELVIPQLFVVSFACSIGVMILYIRLEKPGMNMDRQTGIYNHNAFMEFMAQLYGSRRAFSMFLVVPLNYGKSIYDYEVDMTRINKILGSKKNTLFRKAEDEIAIVFNNREDAKSWWISFVENAEKSEDPDVNLVHNGLWIYIKDSTLFNDADDLMFFIKYALANKLDKLDSKNRNFIYVNDEMVSEMHAEKKSEKILDRALKEGRVEVYYQPIYSVDKQKFVSAEALVRIREKDGTIISPGEFVPVAEKTGKIVELSNEVFKQVCKLIKEGDITQYGIEYIEVNLSVVQCSDENLADSYIATMEKYGVDPKLINLEITESASLKSKEILLNNMNRLIEYGVNFSLDDFGTGQSNLNYIVDMPVEIVKFDKDMTNAYFDNKKAKYVMDAAMHMIHGMGLKIVSEGIETTEQFGMMKDLGISYVQGRYFSEPLGEQEFINYVKTKNGEA